MLIEWLIDWVIKGRSYNLSNLKNSHVLTLNLQYQIQATFGRLEKQEKKIRESKMVENQMNKCSYQMFTLNLKLMWWKSV